MLLSVLNDDKSWSKGVNNGIHLTLILESTPHWEFNMLQNYIKLVDLIPISYEK